THDQRVQLEALRTESRQYQDLGPAGTRLAGLDLSEEQKSKIGEILAKYAPDVQDLRASLKTASDKQAVFGQLRDLQEKMLAEVKAVLTAPQQLRLQPPAQPAAQPAPKQDP